MAWYWIVMIVLAGLFALLFLVYMANLDMKLVSVLYTAMNKMHDKREHERDIKF